MITIRITGAEKLAEAYREYQNEVDSILKQAGEDAVDYVLSQTGLRTYPPETAANRPGRFKQIGNRYIPLGWYERGAGWWTPTYKLYPVSEKYGLKWSTDYRDRKTYIKNSASYNIFVGGDRQRDFHARNGWLQLVPTIYRHAGAIAQIYQNWVNYLFNRIGI